MQAYLPSYQSLQSEVELFLQAEQWPAVHGAVAELSSELWAEPLGLNALPAVVQEVEAVAVVGFAQLMSVEEVELVDAYDVEPHLVLVSVEYVLADMQCFQLSLHASVGQQKVVARAADDVRRRLRVLVIVVPSFAASHLA